MKTKVIVLILLSLISTSLFSQKPEAKKSKELEYNALKSRIENLNNHKRLGKHGLLRLEGVNTNQAGRLKSDDEIMYRLDSVVTENTWKEEYTYNANGNITKDVYYEWDEFTSHWQANEKFELDYDASGNNTLYLEYIWDQESSNWLNGSKSEFTYDASGKMTKDLYYDWDEITSEWVKNYKGEYTYDLNGNDTLFIEYVWNEPASDWVGENKDAYAYDSDGKKTQYISYHWDETTGEWVGSYRVIYNYNDDGKNIQNNTYFWDEATGEWVFNDEREFTYDANWNNTMIEYYVWDETYTAFRIYNKEEFTYDSNGNLTGEIYYNHQLLYWYKIEYTYDLSYNLSSLILPPLEWFDFYYPEKVNNKILESSSLNWDEGSNDWVIYRKTFYYYSELIVTSVDPVNLKISKIYPNPVSDYLMIDIESNNSQVKFELFDICGNKILSKEILSSERINVRGLKSGLYFYNIILGEYRQRGKLIKK
jgi:hypothetical protein